MILFPAIDLKDGKCVRLLKGDMEKATVFNDDAGAQGKRFEEAGARWIHIVDLNGAFEGKPVNKKAVENILSSVQIPVQLGGGIRDVRTIGMWLDAGVNRVILGTIALKNPTLVIQACRQFPDKVAVGIDAKGGKVAVEGWAKTSEMKAEELALKFEDAGVAAIIYTNIDLDGMMQGPDVKGTESLAEKISTPVIASGGVSSIEDIKAIKAIESSGVMGVISGRAIYDGKINIAEAIRVLEA
ncbi:MAG: 1-(5-phosphoribosyl)-5-[(5-phosphoribosylamino)methylideneamino]imidazole-4-carboxamide isomerase [Proteobacteria bacterium]|nr:1-(5-phosphoribosyl)-5-[(5-phosphoribosylamino)methylideneamino]imidazole-4-carboxamide isomerase [Pseudomonadota bacterium]